MQNRKTRPRISGDIYLGYLLHYIVQWPVTANDMATTAQSHGFSGFANFFQALPKSMKFYSPEEIRMAYDVEHPSGKVTGLDDD